MWQNLQRDWFLALNQFAQSTPVLHAPMRAYAGYGVALFALRLNQPLVNLLHAPRPYTVFPHALVLVAHSGDYSLPSDHAVMAGAVAAGVLLTHRRLGVATALAALVMAFARVYVGAHFPLDVIVGLLLGSVVTCLGYLAVRPVLIWVVAWLTRTPLRPLIITTETSLARC